MSTLATPSAKAHERVSGRWLRNIQVETRRDWLAFYAKAAVGAPVPWLLFAFVTTAFLTRAGVEAAAWSIALLTTIYVIADRLSGSREFTFFRAGADLFLLGYVLTTFATAASVATGYSWAEALATLGGARWVALLFVFAYCWELFPGLNRVFYVMMTTASGAALYGLWQHFTGVDVLRGSAVPGAPVGEQAYFMSSSFFNTPEVFGTLIACILPFAAATFLIGSEKGNRSSPRIRWGSFGLTLFLSLAIFWTYRPGIWIAAGSGLLITMLMQGRKQLILIASLAAFFSLVSVSTYHSVDQVFDRIQQSEEARAERQRAQINAEVKLWQETPLIGVGIRAEEAADYDPGTGNVYFQILAQSGLIGLAFYLLFILSFMLSTYRIFYEIPLTHFWHRVLISGSLASQIVFHVAGLYWSTITEAHAMNLFVFLLGTISYLSEHYRRGLVPDDCAL